jgi:hypothetical protein
VTSGTPAVGWKKYLSPTALFWIFYAVACAIVSFKNYGLIIDLFVKGSLLPTVKVDDSANAAVTAIDHVPIYVGAILAHTGLQHPVHLYDPNVQREVVRSLTQPFVPTNALYNPYPPYFWLLLAPLTCLSLENSYVLICGVALVANLASIYAIFRKSGWAHTAVGGMFVMSCAPMFHSFLLGNFSMFLFPSLTLYGLILESKRPIAAGLAMIPYWFKFQYAPIQAMLALQKYPVKFGATVAITLGVMVLVSGLALGFFNYQEWLPYSMPVMYARVATGFENIRGQLAYLPNAEMWTGQPMSSARYILVVALSAWFFFLEIPRLTKRHPHLEFARVAFSLAVLFSALASPYTYDHDYEMVILPCIWIWFWAQKYKQQLGKTVYSGLAFLTVGFPLLSWAFMAFEPIFKWVLDVKMYAIWGEVLVALTLTALYKLCKHSTEDMASV